MVGVKEKAAKLNKSFYEMEIFYFDINKAKDKVNAFICTSPGSCAIYRRNARVLDMQNFILAYMKGWTYVRTIFSEPKFLGCIDCQIFLRMVLRCARFARARAPLLSKEPLI